MKISKEKRDKITEQILALLYHSFPNSMFTAEIAKEIARDEEFTKSLLLDAEKKALVLPIRKNKKGIKYLKRIRWRLTNKVHTAYKQHQA
ncbi:hypothetical protein COV15_01290 [Candidatus Woesearchaeota archaeon CG10_big_fil_rev_8_21_14_0_10_34_12]|nr:MAG: hypothetical protein COV15_01290 [Candidatus Woesearchaeota archaeon CG10_big_fil_rev_8_21_14_0_10_34_12]